MYANLNTTVKLTVERSDKPSYRFLYKIVDKETETVVMQRYCNRRFVAANMAGQLFSSLDTVKAHKAEAFKGEDRELAQAYYCYVEDTTAFASKPTLAWR